MIILVMFLYVDTTSCGERCLTFIELFKQDIGQGKLVFSFETNTCYYYEFVD